MQEFEKGDHVELVSASFEDGGYKSGDVGTVVQTKTCERTGEQDIRVEFDNGAETAWFPADDFISG
ncbi:hypothetical protein [Paenibacillus elgii]|uniref:hypothetical protein n=1 Tax=Paenibacillus elgii TaxID=189691 RepID=UPI0003103943|nr:hypothetical protein [Paenibacillus elgii]